MASSVAAEWDRLTGLSWVGMDTATAFFPWYSFLGEQLRAGRIPVWNPHQFSGAPFAADPESGWMYLPAMLAFALLPLDTAVRAHLLFHVLLAALATYALARTFGANSIGALMAAVVYAHSGFFEGHSVCCYAYADVAAWLPVMLLGAERAIAAASWRSRALWWGVGGLGFSQVLAAWIGQGAYYAALVAASFVVFRCLKRPRDLAVHAAGLFGFGLSLGAAGLLPRLEYNLVSNLPGGYPSADVSLRAASLTDWGFIDGWYELLLRPGFQYIGWVVLALAMAAPILARRQRYVWYFELLAVVVLVLARAQPTPLHAALSFLPGFERITARSPERAFLIFFLSPALLAGAALTVLSRVRFGAALALGIVGFVAFDLHTAWTVQAAESLAGGGDYQFDRLDLAAYYALTPAAQFLESKANDGPFRYVGYAGHVFGGPMPYTLRWQDPSINALQVNNRGLVTRLDDAQGYNPVHIARYDAFIHALNEQTQNYHHTDVFDSGLESPLLDALNVRYILMPVQPASDEVLPSLRRALDQVFEDQYVRVFENPAALPRAWIVHSARQTPIELSSLDLRHVALLEEPPPSLAEPTAASSENVEFVTSNPDHLELHASADAPGLLVLSEAYYPAWHAYVDGQPTTLYAVDGALRGVALPAGQHRVEFRYESTPLNVGLLLTCAAAVVLVLLAILHFAATQSDGAGKVRCKTGAVPQL